MVLNWRKTGKTCLSLLLAVVCLTTSLLFFKINAKADNLIRIGTVEVNSTLNFREGAGTSYKVIGTLYNGDSGIILNQAAASNGKIWYQMTINGKTGWASSDYIRVTESLVKEDEEFTAYLNAQGFPASYHAQLQVLHAQYPNWVFQAQHTGLTWSEVIAGESTLARNLVHAGAATSWKSMQNGAYNWENGTWISFDSGGWVAASTEVIQHFMDPRNFLDDTNIFQFLRQSYDVKEHTEEELVDIKAGLTKMVTNTFLSGNCDGVPYIDVIMNVAADKGVSPYVLASMMIQEMGTEGKSNSMSGKLPGYEGYYNYFNVAAYATGNLTAIQKGLQYAKGSGSYGRPWNTRYKSIAGGAEYYAEGYVKKGQDTMYLKKFNVQGNNLYNHQYMTNVQGASSEGKHMAKAYDENARQGKLVFKIPVYKNMPATPCVKPTNNQNPNYMLKSLSVDGQKLTPTFSMYETEYSLIVPYEVGSINIQATAVTNLTKITGHGTKSLKVGENTFSITSTAENGTKRVYEITVVREAKEEIQEGVIAPTIEVPSYKIGNDNTVSGIPGSDIGITISEFSNKFKVKNGTMKVYTPNKVEKTGDKLLGTGDVVIIFDSLGNKKLEYTIVIYGDTDGDGKILATDYVKVRKYLLGTYSMSGYYELAADTNRNGQIDAVDYVQIRKQILGEYTIQQ